MLVINSVKRPGAGVKAGIQRAVGIEPGNAAPADGTHFGEEPADQEFGVGLDSDGKNIAIEPGLECGVHGTGLGFGSKTEENR